MTTYYLTRHDTIVKVTEPEAAIMSIIPDAKTALAVWSAPFGGPEYLPSAARDSFLAGFKAALLAASAITRIEAEHGDLDRGGRAAVHVVTGLAKQLEELAE